MSEKTIRILVPAFMLIYFAVGFGRWIAGWNEIYPVGAWGMFHYVTRTYEEFDIRIHRHRGRDVEPPVLVSEAGADLGIELDAHRTLVLNGFVTHTRKKRESKAARYRAYLDRVVVGPDSKYEVLRHKRRATPRNRRKDKTSAYGPFETAASFEGDPEASERFEFPKQKRFTPLRSDGHRREKSKKTGR